VEDGVSGAQAVGFVVNWFAICVTVLQVAASIQYLAYGRRADAAIWFLYAAINLILIFREKLE
jgi:hypothetical protein